MLIDIELHSTTKFLNFQIYKISKQKRQVTIHIIVWYDACARSMMIIRQPNYQPNYTSTRTIETTTIPIHYSTPHHRCKFNADMMQVKKDNLPLSFQFQLTKQN